MRVFLLLLGCVLLPWVPARAQWRTEHTVLAISSSAAIAGDWLLTADALRQGTYQELNPILGPHPSLGSLTTYSLLAVGANLAIGRLLPPAVRGLWFAAVTGFESAIVIHQYHIGLRVNLSSL